MSEHSAWEDVIALGSPRQEDPAASGLAPPEDFPLLPPRADVFASSRTAPTTRPAEPRPEVSRLDLSIAVDPFNTGWNAAIGRPPKVVVEARWPSTARRPRSCPSSAVVRPSRRSALRFPKRRPGPSNQPAKKPAARQAARGSAAPRTAPRPKVTRIAPPERRHQAARPAVLRAAAVAGIAGGDELAWSSPSSRSRTSSKASPFCIRATRPSWPTRWGWARRCRPSPPSGCCCMRAKSAACCWSVPSRW